VEGLGPAENGGQRFGSGADDIVIGLLRRQGAPSRLGVETKHPGTRILCHETLAHDLRPHSTSRPELGNFFKEINVRIEEEGEPRSKIIDLQALSMAAST